MSKLKIIHFIPGLTMGGAETLVKDYVLGLDKSKFDVTLLCSIKWGTPYEKILQDAGIRVIYINDYTKHKPKSIFGKFIIQQKRFHFVKKFFQDEQPNVIHVHLGLLRYVKKANVLCSVCYTVHTTPAFVWSHNRREENAARWLVAHNSMRFITLHDEMKHEVDKRFSVKNSLILNNGINIERFNVQVDKSAYRKNLNIPEKAFVVGHIGRFRAEKNHSFLVDVFSEIKKQNSSAFLLMIGDGELKNKISEKLNLLGLKNDYLILSNRTDIPELMKIMDVFVFPSNFEGLGIVLIEAQTVALKCIASENVPSAAKVSNLIKFKSLSDSSKSWADDILSFAVSRPEYYGIEDWDMKNVIKKLEEFYEELCCIKIVR